MKKEAIKQFAKLKFLKIAQEAIKNPAQALALVNVAKSKLDKENIKRQLGTRIDDLKTFLRMIKAYALGNYKDVSKKHLVLCLLAVIYFISPLDMVPDVVLGVGFLDDLAVINWVYLKMIDEIANFKKWEKIRGDE